MAASAIPGGMHRVGSGLLAEAAAKKPCTLGKLGAMVASLDWIDESSRQWTVLRTAPACLRRGIERSILDGRAAAGTISVSEASDQSKVCRAVSRVIAANAGGSDRRFRTIGHLGSSVTSHPSAGDRRFPVW